MATSAGNASVLVPTFQPGEQQHRRRIATWATVVQQRLDDHDSSISAIEASVSAINTQVDLISAAIAPVVMFSIATTSQTVTTAVNTTLTHMAPTVDTRSAMNASSGVYTVPVTGYYMATMKASFNPAAWANADIGGIILKDGSAVVASFNRMNNASATQITETPTPIWMGLCTAGSTLAAAVFQDTGSNKTTEGPHTYFGVARIA